jgi:tRNA (cytidine56-2'-O)-methyltransferase
MSKIVVLRIGHRVYRDSRVTTHVALTARALGASGTIITDQEDKTVELTVRDVVKRFGGHFQIESGTKWRRAVQEWKDKKGILVHLTVYGLSLPECIQRIRESGRDIMVVVGSEKMPAEMFKLADWNVSVTNQPMSEVAALAVFLDWYKDHKHFDTLYPEASVRIIPSRSGKRIERVKN